MSDTQTEGSTDGGPELSVLMTATPEPEHDPTPPPAPERKPERKPERPAPAPAPAVSKDLRAIDLAEDASLRTMLETLGNTGAYFVIVTRLEPEEAIDPATGRRIRLSGMLKKYENELVDEEFVGKRHGGGRYMLKIHRATGKGAQYVPFKQRTIEVAGEPKLDDPCLNRNAAPASASAPSAAPMQAPAEDSKVAVAAMAMAERAMTQKPPEADHRPWEMIIEAQRAQLAALTGQLERMQARMDERAAQPQNPIESKLVTKLLDDDNARITAIRVQHDSELRMLRDQHGDEVKRLNDRFDRMLEAQQQSHSREISSLKSTQEIIKVTLDASGAMSKEVLQGQIKSLERENAAIRDELQKLRDKKDKSPIELMKDMKEIKDAFAEDDDDDDEEGGVIGQIMGKLPDVMGAAGAILGKGPQAQAPQPQVQAPPRPQLLRGPDGHPYRLVNNQWVPVKRKPQMVQGAEGTPPVPMPAIPPERLEMIRNVLEQAFNNGTTPEDAAQTARGMLAGQEEIFTAIRQMGGVDQFLLKVANLPSTSPLLTQAGKNWVRKFSKALVGE